VTAPMPPNRRTPGEEVTTPARDFLADLTASWDAATRTAAVIGLVLALYVAAHDLAHLCIYLGGVLYAAANGA